MSDDEDSAVILRMDSEVSLPRGKQQTSTLLHSTSDHQDHRGPNKFLLKRKDIHSLHSLFLKTLDSLYLGLKLDRVCLLL